MIQYDVMIHLLEISGHELIAASWNRTSFGSALGKVGCGIGTRSSQLSPRYPPLPRQIPTPSAGKIIDSYQLLWFHDLAVYQSWLWNPPTHHALSVLIRVICGKVKERLGWDGVQLLAGKFNKEGAFFLTKIERPCASTYCATLNMGMQTNIVIIVEWR